MSDEIDQPRFIETRKVIRHRGSAHDQEHADHQRENEADHLVARHRRCHATDRQIRSRHQKAPHISGENEAIVRRTQIIDGDDDREGQRSGSPGKSMTREISRRWPAMVIGLVSRSSIVPTRRSSAQSACQRRGRKRDTATDAI